MIHLEDKDGSSIEIYKSATKGVIVLAAQSYDEACPPVHLFLTINDINRLSKEINKFLE